MQASQYNVNFKEEANRNFESIYCSKIPQKPSNTLSRWHRNLGAIYVLKGYQKHALPNMDINARARREVVLPASKMPNSYSPQGVPKNSQYVTERTGKETLPAVCRNRGLQETKCFCGDFAISIKVKVKVNFTLEQARRPRGGVEAQLYSFFNLGIG